MLRSVSVGAKRSLLSVGCAALLMGVCTTEPSYAASNTQVDAMVCSGMSSGASLVISSPASDSVVTTNPVDIVGVVGSITQVDISVDGQYSATIPISVKQTSFLASLQLVEGTHTITFVGNDVCQYQNVTVTLIVTYHPQVSPSLSPAPTVPTAASNNSSVSGPTVNQSGNSSADTPIFGGLRSVIAGIFRELDFDMTARQGGIVAAVFRFAFFVAGIGLAFFGPMVVRLLNKLALRSHKVEGNLAGKTLSDPDLSEHFKRNIILARCSGAILLCLAFAI